MPKNSSHSTSNNSRLTSHISRLTSHVSRLTPKSEFTRNVLTLMTGTTIAQAIPIAISPILTRLYTPEDFGVFALFIAITSIFGSIANGRYELAIMLPKKDEDAINVFALGFIINVVLSLFLLFIVLIFHDHIVKLLNNKEISPWLYFIPVSVFLMGIFNLLNYFNNRMKQYKDIAKANVYKSIGMAVVQLILGFLKAGAVGLISGQIFSQIISNTKLIFNIQKSNLLEKIKKRKLLILSKKYENFPKFSIIHTLFNSFSNNIIFILLSFYSYNTINGFVSMTYRIIGTPSSIISKSMSEIFFRNLSISKRNKKLPVLYKNFLFKILFVFFIIYFFIFILSFKIDYLLGEQWKSLGEYMRILLPMFFFSSVGSIMSNIIYVFGKQKEGFILEIINFFIKVGGLLIGFVYQNVYIGLLLFSLGSSSITIYRFFWYYKIIKEYIHDI